ncbi:elongation of very long chain fatty acids protein AAEL008004-like [Anopheles aquasalis]|uniref:elongation of very long chain fatty acids protein AAEL008004-like n=1 Tax=Anopheles aquasalis TaxID=42839 RepID=UPI00215AEDC6|nr:elongation of very long chain fatty acids protein AAEL008004-like [Anopheles aquasalis]
MALVLSSVYDGYVKNLIDNADERVVGLPLLQSIWTVPAITVVYLFFVLNVGPKLMANRKPLEIRPLIIVYNLVQVAANLAAFILGLKYLRDYHVSLVCQPVQQIDNEQSRVELRLAYAYFLLKILDLADTVFFVLRKKQAHVSFLHVYHHAIMAICASLIMRYLPGGHCFMLGLLNTLVHAVMYFYFFLTIYRPQLTRGATWKRYITLMQMAQFSYLVFHFFRPIVLGVDCGYPRGMMWFAGIQNVFMLILFGDFYRRAYLRNPTKIHAQ